MTSNLDERQNISVGNIGLNHVEDYIEIEKIMKQQRLVAELDFEEQPMETLQEKKTMVMKTIFSSITFWRNNNF